MATKKNIKIKDYEYYRIRRTVGHVIVDGKKKPVIKSFYGASKRDAERKYYEWKENRDNLLTDDLKSFGDMVAYYVDNVFKVNNTYSYNTKEAYLSAYRRFVQGSEISILPFSDVTGSILQNYYNQLSITQSLLYTLHSFLHGFYKWSALNNYSTNIMETVTIPRKQSRRKQNGIIVWTDNEIKIIESAGTDYKYMPIILVGLYAGLRISEVCGLKWTDIYDDTIHINRQMVGSEFTAPKYNSYRQIPMHPKIKKAFDQLDHSHDLIFTSRTGHVLYPPSIRNILNTFYRRNGIPAKKYHAYRATFVTNLCKKGVPLQVASKLAGHSSINVTAKYYALVSTDEYIDAISRL